MAMTRDEALKLKEEYHNDEENPFPPCGVCGNPVSLNWTKEQAGYHGKKQSDGVIYHDGCFDQLVQQLDGFRTPPGGW